MSQAGKTSTRKLPKMAAGQRYGRLVALERAGTYRKKQARWLFLCDCGETCIVMANSVRQGLTKSCGCPRNEKAAANGKTTATHKMTRSPEYISWVSMKGRCENPNDPSFFRYGACGIKVCARWRKFENFYADMGPRPKGSTLDRYPDNDGDYKKTNCRWATPKQQATNRRPRRKAT